MRVRRCVKNHVRLKKTVGYLLIAVAAYFGKSDKMLQKGFSSLLSKEKNIIIAADVNLH